METNGIDFKELVYYLMNGAIESEKVPSKLRRVENEFAQGRECEKAYQQVYDANRRICERSHVQEDMDVECIISNYSTITRTLCMKMYDYGSLFAHDENTTELIKFFNNLSEVKKEKFMEFVRVIQKAL